MSIDRYLEIFWVIIAILIALLAIPLYAEADELKHIIRDIDVYGTDNWEDTKCIDGTYNHLFINLSYADWIKIGNYIHKTNEPVPEGRERIFQADFCVKCRLIPVRCSGTDWFRYILEENLDTK